MANDEKKIKNRPGASDTAARMAANKAAMEAIENANRQGIEISHNDFLTAYDNAYKTSKIREADAETALREEVAAGTKQMARQGTARSNALTSKKVYDDYVASDEYRAKLTERTQRQQQRQWEADLLTGIATVPTIELEADEKEQRLKAEADYWAKKVQEEDNQRVMAADIRELEEWSEEDREALEVYAVERNRDFFSDPLYQMPLSEESQALIAKYGKARADEMANSFMRQQNQQLNEETAQQAYTQAQEHPVLHSIGGRAAGLLDALTGVGSVMQGLGSYDPRYGNLDPNGTGSVLSTYQNAATQGVANLLSGDIYDESGNLIQDGGKLRGAVGLLYEAAMSAADSGLRVIGGAIGTAGLATASGAAALAFSSSFGNAVRDASARGAGPAQAVAYGAGVAGLEYLTEKIPADEILRIAKGGKQGFVKNVWNILKQGFAEATTEEISLMASNAWDAVTMGEQSADQQRLAALVAAGVPYKEAQAQVQLEQSQEAWKTAILSGLSGSMTGAASVGLSHILPADPEIQQKKTLWEQLVEGLAGDKKQPETAQQPQTAQENTEDAGVESAKKELGDSAIDTGRLQPNADSTPNSSGDVTQAPAAGFSTNHETNAQSDLASASPDTNIADHTPEVNQNPPDRMAMSEEDFLNSMGGNGTAAQQDPFSERNWSDMGKRSEKAFMHENPQIKHLFQMEAYNLLGELGDSTKGERWFNEDVHYETGGESGWGGVKRHTSESIADLLDNGFTYDQIEKGLNAIIEDNGKENNALSKRIEFIINDRLLNGYKDFYGNGRVGPSPDYVAFVNGKSTPSADTQGQSTAEGQDFEAMGAADRNFSGKPAYNATLSEDNAQADRRDDVRPMELPQRDVNGNNISAVTGNVYGAGVTPDEFASLMEEPTARGDFSYVPISNNDATQQAMENISRYGWQDAYTQWSIAVHQGRAGAEMSARGALFLNHAAQAGDRRQWLNILSDFQRLGTNTAQGLQAFRILRNLAPSDRLYMMRRSVAQMVEDMHLNVPIEIDQQLAEQYQNAQTNEEADAILDEIITDVASQIPSTIGDRWTALRYVNMLGNLRTQARNISGNIGAKFTYMAKDQIGAALEKVVHAFNPDFQRTKSSWVSNELKALGRGDFDEVRDIVLENGRFDDARRFDSTYFAREANERRRIFRSGFMESYRRLTNWAMNNDYFGDAGFARSAYARAFGGYLKANGFTGNTLEGIDQGLLDDARLYAIQQAQESTFRDHNAVSDWVGRIGRRQDTPRAIRALSEGVMPFRSTPANVLVRAEEFSPLGIINTAVTAARAANPNSEITGTDVVESMAKTLTGTGLFIMGAYLGKMGLLSGGPDKDEEKAEFDELNGYQNYALRLPDGKSITIDFLSPLAVPMFLGAELEKIISDGGYDLADFEKVFTSLADPLIQMSMLQGLNDTLDGIKYSDNNLGQLFLNAAMSYLTQGLTNTLLGQLERSSEENRMTTFIDKDSAVPQWMQRQLGKMSQKIPGWDYQQSEYLNAWGETEENEGGLLYNLLSPGYVSKEQQTAVTQELYRLRDVTGENVFPQASEKTLNYTDKNGTVHTNYHLSAEEFGTLQRTEGQTAKRILSTMIGSANYKVMTDEQKAKAIEQVYSYAREYAQIQAIKDHNGYTENWMMEVKPGSESAYILRRVIDSEMNRTMSNLDSAWDNGWETETRSQELQTAYDSYSKMSPSDKATIKDFATGTTAKYIEARENGVSHNAFLSAAKNVNNVTGTGKNGSIRDIDRRAAIASTTGLSESQIDIIMKCYMPDYDPADPDSEKTELKYDYIREEMGLSAAAYAETYRAHLDNSKKADKIAAIMALGYDKATATTLYNIYASSDKGKELYMSMYES